MLTLEMIKNIKQEDRNFWLNKCTAKELKEIVKNWGDRKLKKQLGYSCKFVKSEVIEFIGKIIDYEEQEKINECFENAKKQAKTEVAEQLAKGDNISDLELKRFYYELVENYYEEDRNLKEMNDPWRRIFRESEDVAKRYYKGLVRYFHSDTSEYADTEMFNIVKNTYKYNKEEYEYYKNLDVDLDEDIDFSDIEINVNMEKSAEDEFDFGDDFNDNEEYVF